MSCKIQIVIPGDGTFVVPIWRALEANGLVLEDLEGFAHKVRAAAKTR